MNTPPISEILKEMGHLTALSGRICDLQIHNLKMYSLVFFEDVTEAKIEYDLMPIKTVDDEPVKNNLLISYFLTLNETSNNNLDKRFLALEKSVRTIFWNDVTIEVYFNNKIKYKSPKHG
jgi:hypothetical protein